MSSQFFLLMEGYHGVYAHTLKNLKNKHHKSYQDLTSEVFSKALYYGDVLIEALEKQRVSAQHLPRSTIGPPFFYALSR